MSRSRPDRRKYTKAMLEPLVASSASYADVARAVGVTPHGGAQALLKKRIVEYGLDASHFLGKAWNKGRILSNQRKKPKDVFVLRPPGSYQMHGYILKRALLETGTAHECAICGLGPEWQGKPLIMIVDHIDGNNLDNRRRNLRLLCSNCDSQTPTYKSRNGKRKPTGDGTRFEPGRA